MPRVKNKYGRFITGEKKYLFCRLCGKKFFTFPCHGKGRKKYCSRTCSDRSKKGKPVSLEERMRISKALKGKKNHNWKGGITPFRLKIWTSRSYKEWRQKVFTRDSFTCQNCGVLGGDLEAHHKKPFYKLIQEAKEYLPLFNLYDAVIAYVPMWNVGNGVTLCKKCHNLTKRKR